MATNDFLPDLEISRLGPLAETPDQTQAVRVFRDLLRGVPS